MCFRGLIFQVSTNTITHLAHTYLNRFPKKKVFDILTSAPTSVHIFDCGPHRSSQCWQPWSLQCRSCLGHRLIIASSLLASSQSALENLRWEEFQTKIFKRFVVGLWRIVLKVIHTYVPTTCKFPNLCV